MENIGIKRVVLDDIDQLQKLVDKPFPRHFRQAIQRRIWENTWNKDSRLTS